MKINLREFDSISLPSFSYFATCFKVASCIFFVSYISDVNLLEVGSGVFDLPPINKNGYDDQLGIESCRSANQQPFK